MLQAKFTKYLTFMAVIAVLFHPFQSGAGEVEAESVTNEASDAAENDSSREEEKEAVEAEPDPGPEDSDTADLAEKEIRDISEKGEETDLDPGIREELQEDIREFGEELRREIQADMDREREILRAEIGQSLISVLSEQQREPERWIAEPAPRPAFFEMDGYFRLRGDVFLNLDMNAGLDVHGRPLFPTPVALDSDTFSSANQRLRLDPVFNISEELRIRTTVDVLDNIVWGQNPDIYPRNPGTQNNSLLIFSETQAVPMAGVNAARDSLSVKRAWGEVHTPLGWLHFGRMGSHWGLGMLVNDGDDIDGDYGTTVDRLMFITPVGDHFFMPVSVDLLSSGPVYRHRNVYEGQPFSFETRDNAVQYMVALARRDSDIEIRRQVLAGRPVINYGFYNLIRRQAWDYVGPDNPQVFNDPIYMDNVPAREDFISRGAFIYMPDLWFRLNTSRLRLEFEAAAVLGKIDNGLLRDAGSADENSVSVTQIGAVAQGELNFLRERLRLSLETGYASGDRAPGMGIDSSPGGRLEYPEEGAIDGRQYNLDTDQGAPEDRTLNNFRFNRAYHVDEILWRRVFGQITDAVYVRPGLSYDLAPGFGFDLAAIYSRAVFVESTPGPGANLGLELNAGLRYMSRDGFILRGVYGILFPFSGLELEAGRSPEIAQVIRGMAAISF